MIGVRRDGSIDVDNRVVGTVFVGGKGFYKAEAFREYGGCVCTSRTRREAAIRMIIASRKILSRRLRDLHTAEAIQARAPHTETLKAALAEKQRWT